MVGTEGIEPPSFYNLPRCAAPVASHLVRNEIQHTNCFSACGLLDGFSSVRDKPPFYSQTGTMPFLARSDSVPTY